MPRFSPIERVRRLPPLAADGLLAALVVVVGVIDLFGGPGLSLPLPYDVHEPDAVGAAMIAVMGGALTWRRRAPMAVLAVSGIGNIVYNALGYPDSLGAGMPVLIALYSVAAHGDRRDALVGGAATVVGIAVALVVVSRNLPGVVTFDLVLANYVVFVVAWVLGDNVRTRRAYVRELEARAADLERRQAEAAERAVGEERARIARELHDVVAHDVSVMTVQAGAARRVADRRPDEAVTALAAIEQVGRQALADLRRLLGVLRHEDASTDARAPQPTLRDIRSLVRQVREAGVPVDLEVEGEPRLLPDGVDLSAYRIAQEALTNVLKHAGDARAAVRIRYGDAEVELEVVDDGRGAAAALRSGQAGHGLVGMRERVAVFGGHLEVGPRPGGGFRVHAVLPYRPRPETGP